MGLNFYLFDIFEIIQKSLSISDTINFLMINKSCYNIYKSNIYLCNHLFANKILSYFGFKSLNGHSITDSIRTLLHMYYYFKNHPACYRVDFIIYMVDNSINDINLFKFFISQYSHTPHAHIDNKGVHFSDNDMEYILKNCNYDQLNIILDSFVIPINILSNTIAELNDDNMMLVIKYLFKETLSLTDGGGVLTNYLDKNAINQILLPIITINKTHILRYFIKKKHKDQKQRIILHDYIDYQFLINKCIEATNKSCLNILIHEMNSDNKTNNIVVNTHQIINLCENANFSYLKYLTQCYLGNTINSVIYIDSIILGLKNLILFGKSYNSKKIKTLDLLSDYIDYENKIYINKHLIHLYDTIKLEESKRFFM